MTFPLARPLRPAQQSMLLGPLRTKRHQLVAGMGLGKSGAVMALASLIRHSTWPGLVVLAPLQVGLNWLREAPLWRPDKSIRLVAGSLKERMAALAYDPDITVVSYDSVDWLAEYMGSNWDKLGAMGVADESTRIKSTRAVIDHATGAMRLYGGPRTNALALHSFDFEYWLGMTGTIVPNGLPDLWGQYWHIDGGLRLETSYGRYMNRWFTVPDRRDEFTKPIPHPGALQEIASLVADVTTVVRVEDYYSLDKPNVVDRPVFLPAKAKRVYDEMKHTMMAALDSGAQVQVEQASARATKLLQISAGFIYHGDEEDPDVKLTQPLHDAKLDALDSIIEETGENLVVVYYFQAELAALQARYKDRLRTLDKTGQAQDDWNSGKVPLLALQYSQGSLGLSLQHGGRSIVLMTPTSREEDYEQIIERLGPMRQMQSGYKRTVNVYRLIAEGGADASAFRNVANKMGYQSMATAVLAGCNRGIAL